MRQLAQDEGLHGDMSMATLVQRYDVSSLVALIGAHDQARAALSSFTFDGDISSENRGTLIARHWIALSRGLSSGILAATEKESLKAAYGRAIHHTILSDPDANASATVGGSTLNVNFGVLFPQGNEEISQTLIHEMMHCAGFTHPERRDPPPGRDCSAPDPDLFDCPNDNGQYYGTAPLRAEFCIAGDQSDASDVREARFVLIERKSGAESCAIDGAGVATIHTTG
ncbi:hypothetical protein [Streptomyces sp. NBC_00887]|uniref:hypothetical protein n=1 Tax=Streptomyces sp. NBC_00887 TaxID=2975859 RepID=UPI003868DECF|nr:hypothetical protein OG844_01495 [Streptomyces sp. NBC_00887]WSY36894.1 hypothetical protein OG844_44105 [Streptomyces sp. NBC_00887]